MMCLPLVERGQPTSCISWPASPREVGTKQVFLLLQSPNKTPFIDILESVQHFIFQITTRVLPARDEYFRDSICINIDVIKSCLLLKGNPVTKKSERLTPPPGEPDFSRLDQPGHKWVSMPPGSSSTPTWSHGSECPHRVNLNLHFSTLTSTSALISI